MFIRLIFIIVASFLFSCRSTFSGRVTYEISIVSNDGDKKVYNYYESKYGDTLVIDYQMDGDMKRNHRNGTLDYQLYSAEDGAVLFVYHNLNIDTFPCIEFSLNKIYKKRTENEKIIGRDCKCYEIMSTLRSNGDSVLIDACYPKNNKKLFVRHKLYSTYQDYYIHELFKENKAPYFRYYIHYPEISIKYEGLKVDVTE